MSTKKDNKDRYSQSRGSILNFLNKILTSSLL